LTRQPNYGLAVVGKACCKWLLRNDVTSARALISEKLAQFPKDTGLLSIAHFLSLADDDLETGEQLLRRLLRVAGGGPEAAGNRGMDILCNGRHLAGATSVF
jgi:hypothetical protein